MKFSVIIPCYNESENVGRMAEQLLPVIAALEQRGPTELLLVNDGSTDDTRAQLEALAARCPGIRVLNHARNQGLGAALRTGFAQAQGEIIITTDSDGTYPFTEILPLLERLTPEVDVVTASPYHPQGGVEGVPRYRLILSQGASLLYRLLLAWRLHTYTAMFRAYRREAIQRVPSTANGFLMPAEWISNAILLGYRVAEFPTVLHVRQYGQSKAKVLRIILAHLRFQARLIGLRLRGRRPSPRTLESCAKS